MEPKTAILISIVTMNVTAVNNKANNKVDKYFDNRIAERLHGLISNSLIVPHVNSPATVSEATTTVNIVIRMKEIMDSLSIISQLETESDPDAATTPNEIKIGRPTIIPSMIHVRTLR